MQEMIHGTMAGHDGSSHGAYSAYSPWLDLAAAIVKAAADDYIKVLRRLWRGNASIPVKRKLIAEKAEIRKSLLFYTEGLEGTDPGMS